MAEHQGLVHGPDESLSQLVHSGSPPIAWAVGPNPQDACYGRWRRGPCVDDERKWWGFWKLPRSEAVYLSVIVSIVKVRYGVIGDRAGSVAL